jgi:hypothetical protein
MPSAANGDNLYIGRGKFYFDRYDANMQPSGILRFVGEADKGDISISSSNKSRYTTTRATNNKIASVDTQQTHSIAIDLMEFVKDNLALALLGTAGPVTQSGNTLTDEAVAASASAGSIYKLKYRNVSAVTLKVGGTALDGDDFEIEDPRLGLVRILPSATVGAGALTASYTSETVTFDRVASGKNTAIYGRLVYIGDPTLGPGFDLEAWKVKFMSAGVVSLLSDDFDKLSLTGEILDDTPNHPTAPLYQLTYRDSGGGSNIGSSLTLGDGSDGHNYVIAMVSGNLEVELGDDEADTATLTLADQSNGSYYAVTMEDGNLTVTSSSSAGAVGSLLVADQVDGHIYSLTSVDGKLTVTLIS